MSEAESLSRLREVLAAAGLRMPAEELADVLRLALTLPGDGSGHSARPSDGSPGIGTCPPRPTEGPLAVEVYASPSARPPAPGGREAPGAPPGPGRARVPIRLPGAKSLPNELALGRTLRPLKHRVPSASRYELDVDATVDSTADSGMPTVELRRASERWMRLALVLDGGLPSLLWHRHAVELRDLFAQSAAFSRVEVHRLDRDPLVLRRPWRREGPPRSPRSLVDATGRTMVLLLTDGSTDWSAPALHEALAAWSAAGPTAILQALPRRMWRRTQVSGEDWTVVAPRPGAPNRSWEVRHPVLPQEFAPEAALRIPVLELTPASLSAWSAVTTSSGHPVHMTLWSPPEASTGAELRPRPGIRQFQRGSSPEAQRLAAYLALFAPVSVPVMHLIHASAREGASGDAVGGHSLAEIVLSGLLAIDPATEMMGFEPEAQAVLLSEVLPTSELVTFRSRVGQRIMALTGRSRDVMAGIAAQSTAQETVVTPHLTRLPAVVAEAIREGDESPGTSPVSAAGNRGDEAELPGDSAVQPTGPAQAPVRRPLSAPVREWEPAPIREPVRVPIFAQQPDPVLAPLPYPVQRADSGGSTPVRVGLWGAVGSGKTTYLSALPIAAVRQQRLDQGNWVIGGMTQEASDYLTTGVRMLASERRFPQATQTVERLNWSFTGETASSSRWRRRKRQVQFQLEVQDVPGEFFLHGRTSAPQVLDHLARSNGLVYLFDPLLDAEEGLMSINYLYTTLSQLGERIRDEGRLEQNRLPHHVAVCVTKFDHPDIFRPAVEAGWVQQDDTHAQIPRVPTDLGEQYFNWICDDFRSGTARLVRDALRTFFRHDRTSYYASSAIGFRLDAQNVFDFRSYANVETVEGFSRICSSPSPINVLEPLIDLEQRIRTQRRRRG